MGSVIMISVHAGLVLMLLVLGGFTSAVAGSGSLTMSAVIATKGTSCTITPTEKILQFKPIKVNQLSGSVQTFQIKPLRLLLACGDETAQSIQPILTLEGDTPYTETQQTVFLNGTPNGVGFMVRTLEDNSTPSLADFYQPDAALSAGGKGVELAALDTGNVYQNETQLWVGLVGPFQSQVTPGAFDASLILNVAFQ